MAYRSDEQEGRGRKRAWVNVGIICRHVYGETMEYRKKANLGWSVSGLKLNPESLSKVLNSSRTFVCSKLLATFERRLPSLLFTSVCLRNTKHTSSLLRSSSFRNDHHHYIQYRAENIPVYT
jgi:hypothetical protein